MKQSRLVLLRHAKSDRSVGGRDFDRPLNKRGQRSAPLVGKWLKKQKLEVDRLVCSPARRARDTGLAVAKALGFGESAIAWEQEVYDASLPALVGVLEKYGPGAKCLLLVGHNPGLDELLSHLSTEPPPRDDRGRLLTTAAVAVLAFDGPIKGGAGTARLETLYRPRTK